MGFEQLIIAAKDWGPTAITTIIAVIISYIIKQQAKNSSEDIEREKKIKENLSNALTRVERKIDENFNELKKRIDAHDRRISVLEIESAKKEDLHRELGGWRSEINRLQDLIVSQIGSFTQKIIELWKDKKC